MQSTWPCYLDSRSRVKVMVFTLEFHTLYTLSLLCWKQLVIPLLLQPFSHIRILLIHTGKCILRFGGVLESIPKCLHKSLCACQRNHPKWDTTTFSPLLTGDPVIIIIIICLYMWPFGGEWFIHLRLTDRQWYIKQQITVSANLFWF